MSISPYHRGRFYSMPKWDGSLSSRFGNTPIRMEREDLLENDRRRYAAWNNRPILPPITNSLPSRNLIENNQTISPRQTPRSKANDAVSERDYRMKRICDIYLPSNGTLTTSPVTLSGDEELILMQQCKSDLKHVNPEILKSVYLEMADLDPRLSGYLAFQDIITTLTNNKMYVGARPLCLLASMFVSRSELGVVNYERLLSFLGAAMKMTADDFKATSPTPNENSAGFTTYRIEKPTYYQGETQRQSMSTPNDSSMDATLLRDLSESLKNHNGRPVDFEGLRMAFQRADSLVRGTLSAHQIKSICNERGVPLHDDLIERGVQRCTHRGGGQYDWQQFVNLLERVQPLQTGLFIPQSKRPLDYVKPMPNPSSSWPHADTPSYSVQNPQTESGRYYEDIQQQKTPQIQGQSTARDQYYAMNNLPGGETDYSLNQPAPVDNNKYSNETLPSWAARSTEEFTSRGQAPIPFQQAQQFTSYPNDLKQQPPLSQPQDIPSRAFLPPAPARNDPYSYEVEKESWLNRFMRLANALYREDKECRGTLPQEAVHWLANQYNTNFLLKLDENTINEAMNVSKRPNGRVDLSSFLKILSMKG